MGILRFPNPGSDIRRFISTFSTIYRELQGKKNFTHDDTRDAVVRHGLASSSGAIGAEAIKRSTNENRSLDPLFNQLKMYSELYRMLGWLQPGTMNTNFNFTELSPYVANSSSELQNRIFEECLLAIVFPNPHLENRSGNHIRPFPIILRLLQSLDNTLLRDELIVSVYPLHSDNDPTTIKHLSAYIKGIRGDSTKLKAELEKLSNKNHIMVGSLQNYTRFPLGSLKHTDWAEARTIRTIYEKPIKGLCLKKKGIEKANQISKLIDVRNHDIQDFSLSLRASFTLFTHYVFLKNCGFPIPPELITRWETASKPILEKLNISVPEQILYSPMQQSTLKEIAYANELDQKENA